MNFDDDAIAFLVLFGLLMLVLFVPILKVTLKIILLAYQHTRIKLLNKPPEDCVVLTLHGGDKAFLFVDYTEKGTPFLNMIGLEKPLHKELWWCIPKRTWNSELQIPNCDLTRLYRKLWEDQPVLADQLKLKLHKVFGGRDIIETINNFIILYGVFYGKLPPKIFYGADVPDYSKSVIKAIELGVGGYSTVMKPMFEESPQPCLMLEKDNTLSEEVRVANEWFVDKMYNEF